MQEDLLKYLTDDTELAELHASYKDDPTIFWVTRPRGASSIYPATTLRLITPVYHYDQKDRADLIRTRVQVDVWAKQNLQDAWDIMNRILVLMNLSYPSPSTPRKVAGSTEFDKIYDEGARDMPVLQDDDGVDILHISGDFMIWHRPTVT